jgi:hypothetical protein
VAKQKLLGDLNFKKGSFSKIDAVFSEFKKKEFRSLTDWHRSDRVSRALLGLIQKEPEPCFLLAAALDFIQRIEADKVLASYTFSSFELWLNQYSGLSFEENYRIRSKIAGKWIQRDDYHPFFPIGMGKIYEGTHFVTAHKSPDLDTTVASFWGWLDAFAARVGDGLHIWNVPGGPPPSQIEIEWMFRNLFGESIFTHLAKTKTVLELSGNDLMSQKGLVKKQLTDSIADIDHDRDHHTVIVVDGEGFYLGDWRHLDAEGVRQVIILLGTCLRWFENRLNLQILSLFAKEPLQLKEATQVLKSLFSMKIQDCGAALEFSPKQRNWVGDFMLSVLGLKEGISCDFDRLGSHLGKMAHVAFSGADAWVQAIKPLFDSKGRLVAERPKIFRLLESALGTLHEAIVTIRQRLERLDIALKTKSEVFGSYPNPVSVRSDVEEILSKMGPYPSLTVTYPDRDGRLFPVGAILASDLRKNTLATASLRDFCNREEMGIPSHFEVISVVDHHKTSLNTFSPPLVIISDVQSSNTLIAERAFKINDRYSTLSLSAKEIDEQIKGASSTHTLQRLLTLKSAADQSGGHFIHPEREMIEYLHFLYAILDDTDLLTKVSAEDVVCVASLLNRIKSLSLKRQVEVVSLSDIPRGKSFAKTAAQRLLQNEDMYSLYKKVHAYREKEVEIHLELSAKAKPSNSFADTKEQNGCCRVGQTKMFVNNVAHFSRHADAIRRVWLDHAIKVHAQKPEIDLHIHMISTLVSAEEVYQGSSGAYSHKDEIWIWIPPEETAILHLKHFLNGFIPALKNFAEVEFLGNNAPELSQIFLESAPDVPQKTAKRNLPLAVIRTKAGSVNSRKAMVSPYLPRIG